MRTFFRLAGIGLVLFLVLTLPGQTPGQVQDKKEEKKGEVAPKTYILVVDEGGSKSSAIIRIAGLKPKAVTSPTLKVKIAPTSTATDADGVIEMTFRGRKVRILADLAMGSGEAQYFPESLGKGVVISVPRGTAINPKLPTPK